MQEVFLQLRDGVFGSSLYSALVSSRKRCIVVLPFVDLIIKSCGEREKFDVFQFVCEGLSGQFEMEILVAIN